MLIDWSQLSVWLLTACGALLSGIAIFYMRRVDRLEEAIAGFAVINTLLTKHEVRLDAIDQSIHHVREFAHETRNLMPSDFEKREGDRRRNETHENFVKIFERMDEMRTERFQYHTEVVNLLHTKQDKPR